MGEGGNVMLNIATSIGVAFYIFGGVCYFAGTYELAGALNGLAAAILLGIVAYYRWQY